ncbi:inositol monophosphatase family protein [Chryseobacterium shigense]|uniref:Myo-inositol-1(Or 4)-monophosphatase n=1 Tax=Chryseobacterium shigense TaxID=297244 RepID=A0A841NFK7_9FLAO|nr:inositol monophosphatase family protein [Chryseobacterium shigense]MBB6372628.1 myo-inositol-1(or 4)-monophosphatase [Chryseobacterium shigense]
MELESIMNYTIGLAYRAGNLLLNHENNHVFSKKNEFNDIGAYVSEMDKKSEELIMKMISVQFPSHNLCGEESGLIDKNSEYTWYIDPLDGTYNYIRGYPMWGVSIGLSKNQTPIIGVLYFPKLNKLVYAGQELGAYNNEKKLQVSKLDYTDGCYSVPTYKYQEKQQAIIELIEKMSTTKIHHCSSFDFACLAEGNTEVILSGTLAPWDSCAGVCIVREAGGVVVNLNGNDWIMSSEYIIAMNKYDNSIIELIKNKKLEILEKNFLIPEIKRSEKNNPSQIEKLKH